MNVNADGSDEGGLKGLNKQSVQGLCNDGFRASAAVNFSFKSKLFDSRFMS